MEKKVLTVLICLLCISSLFAGGEQDAAPEGPSTVTFWYLWGGVEGERVEEMITSFNASQGDYVVEGLSVPDQQKIQVSIAAGDGPDVSDTFSSLTAAYANKGILEPLNPFIDRDGYDLSDFMPAALESGTVDGVIYSLPISVNLMMLYYNKDLLAKAGYTNPPSTDSELMEYAMALTEVDSSGALKVQGFPDFPEVYFVEHMPFALGGEYGKPGALTVNNQGTRRAMEMITEYRKAFGLNNILAFNSSGGYMSSADPFITGRQALRIDGPWFGNHITNTLNSDLNYAVAPIPYSSDLPGSERGGQVQSSTFFIPSNATNKEGAWSFVSWLHEEAQMTELCAKMGWTPARVSALESPVFDNVLNFEAFAAQAKSSNLTTFPAFDGQQELMKIISDAFQEVMLQKNSVDNALSSAQAKAEKLK
jgi:multiple sugar transport system substrate-binding protein